MVASTTPSAGTTSAASSTTSDTSSTDSTSSNAASLAEMRAIFQEAQQTALETTKMRIQEGSKLDIVKQRLPT